MNAKLDNLSELSKLLGVKSDVCDNLLVYFRRMNLGRMLCRLSLEKQQGVSAAQLTLSLCLFRVASEGIHSIYRKCFYELLATGKNCYYKMPLYPAKRDTWQTAGPHLPRQVRAGKRAGTS